jgi:hypothetical protein
LIALSKQAEAYKKLFKETGDRSTARFMVPTQMLKLLLKCGTISSNYCTGLQAFSKSGGGVGFQKVQVTSKCIQYIALQYTTLVIIRAPYA